MGCAKCKRSGHDGGNCRAQKTVELMNEEKGKKMICHGCNQEGHSRRTCTTDPYPRNNNRNNFNNSQPTNNVNGGYSTSPPSYATNAPNSLSDFEETPTEMPTTPPKRNPSSYAAIPPPATLNKIKDDKLYEGERIQS